MVGQLQTLIDESPDLGQRYICLDKVHEVLQAGMVEGTNVGQEALDKSLVIGEFIECPLRGCFATPVEALVDNTLGSGRST